MQVVFFLNTYGKMSSYNIDQIDRFGYTFIAITTTEQSYLFGATYSKFFRQILPVPKLDILETQSAIATFCTENHIQPEACKVVCMSEVHMLLAGQIREHFKMSGMYLQQTELFRDKIKMKNTLLNTNIALPKYIDCGELKYTTAKNLFDYLLQMLGPKFVIKPKAEFSGNGVHIITSYNDFTKIIDNIKPKIKNYEAETFIEGRLHQIDSFHKNGQAIFQQCSKVSFPNFDFQLGKPVIVMPLPDESSITHKAKELAQTVLQQFEYTNGPSHLEFFVTDNQELLFLEVAARTSGANVVEMYSKMFNFNLANADLYLHMESKKLNWPQFSGKYYLGGIFPTKNGVITKLNAPTNLNGVFNIKWHVSVGNKHSNAVSVGNVAAEIMVENTNYEAANLDFDTLCDSDLIQTSS